MTWKYFSKKEIIAISVLIIFAFFLRVYFFKYHLFIETDGAEYATLGKNLVTGHGYVGISGRPDLLFPPLFPLLTGITYLIINNLEISGSCISLLFGVLIIIPIYLIAKQLFSSKVGIISCILVSLLPVLVFYSIITLTESIYAFLIASSAIMGYFALIEGKKIYYISFGFLIGLCYLTRPEAIEYIPIFVVFVFIRLYINNKNKCNKDIIKNTAIYSSLVIISFIIIVLPYLLFLYNTTGEFSLGSGADINMIIGEKTNDGLSYEQIGYGLSDNGKEMRLDLLVYDKLHPDQFDLINYITTHPYQLLTRYINNFIYEFTNILPQIYPLLLIISLVIGILCYHRNGAQVFNELFIFSFILIPLITYPVFFINSAYLVPILPLLLIWSSNGVSITQDWINKLFRFNRIKNSYVKIFLYNMILIIVVISLIPLLMTYATDNSLTDQKETGLLLKNIIPDNSIIMSRKPYVSFYSDKLFLPIPYGNYSQMMYYARSNNVSYIVIDERFIPSLRPDLAFLTNESNAPAADLQLVYKYNNYPKVLVYKLL